MKANAWKARMMTTLILLAGTAAPLSASEGAQGLHVDGGILSLWWCLPFIGILLSIAVLPLFTPHFWHHHFGKVSFFWGALFFAGFTAAFGLKTGAFTLTHVYLGEFLPFIVLLLALFTVSGGIRLTGTLRGSPGVNTLLLAIGTFLASWMGTTGASMLLIRPMLRANGWRKKNVHIVIFFIFLVSNIGGSLTPLGDPPLFLGFLKGISFFWTASRLLPLMGFATVILLALFYAVDRHYFNKEGAAPAEGRKEPLGIEGKLNLLYLLGIVGSVVLSGVWHADSENPGDVAIRVFGEAMITKGTLLQMALLLAITYLSVRTTPRAVREGNGFTWDPILEVTKLFATIFITMVAPIAILRAGVDGALGSVVALVSHDGEPVNSMYFWCTGALSSFLDNAPTYLVFFNTAGGDPAKLMGEWAQTLTAISAGAVFMGANSYIGNAPNFMVKSIAEENKIAMPSFFGYMAWSVGILVPLFLVMTFIFF